MSSKPRHNFLFVKVIEVGIVNKIQMVESMFASAKASTNSTTIAFVGKTGAGKTTLMNALAKQELGK